MHFIFLLLDIQHEISRDLGGWTIYDNIDFLGTDSITSKPTNKLYNICTMLHQRQKRWADAVQMLY